MIVRRFRRTGFAPIEMAMALPILALFAAAGYRLGEGHFKKTVAIARARAEASKMSPHGPDPSPFPNRTITVAGLGPKSNTYGLVSRTANDSQDMSPVLQTSAPVSGLFSGMIGTWDYRAIPYPGVPSIVPLTPVAMRLAAVVGALSGQIGNLLPNGQSTGANRVDTSGSRQTYRQQSSQANSRVQEANNRASQIRSNSGKSPEMLKNAFPGDSSGLVDLLTHPAKLKQAIKGFSQMDNGVAALKKLISKVEEYGKRQYPPDDFR